MRDAFQHGWGSTIQSVVVAVAGPDACFKRLKGVVALLGGLASKASSMVRVHNSNVPRPDHEFVYGFRHAAGSLADRGC
jgi:hypothetical protein